MDFTGIRVRPRRPGRRISRLALLGVLTLTHGWSCPPSNEPSTGEASGDRIVASPSPLVVAQGDRATSALRFESRSSARSGGFSFNGARAGLAARIDTTRTTEATPNFADLVVEATTIPPGTYPIDVRGGATSEPTTTTIDVIVLPRGVGALPGIAAVDAGDAHTLAVLADGSVWAWGANARGQLGDGTITDRSLAIPVVGLPGRAIRVSAGGRHSLALLEDGTIWAWGANDFRQIGAAEEIDGITLIERPQPLACRDFRCDPLPRFIEIAAGRDHSLALDEAGVVWAWGRFRRGALGRDPRNRESGIAFPIGEGAELSEVARFVAIAAGDSFSLALEDDGRVWGWGDNARGQLGDDFRDEYPFPTELSGVGPGTATALAAGSAHSLVLTTEGNVLAAGANDFGQLGLADRETARFLPVPGLSRVVAIAAGLVHSISLHEDGTAETWGSNAFDQLGFPERTPPAFESIPSSVQSVPLLRAIAAGGRHAFGLARDCPQLWAWGDNGAGQLGIGNTQRNGFAGRSLAFGDASGSSGTGDCGLPLSVAIAGDGAVASDRGSIDCPADGCSDVYDRDTFVRLTAVAAEGQRFVGWSGDVVSPASTVDVRVVGSTNVLARFVPDRRPPIAAFSFAPTSPTTNDVVRFDASSAYDPDGTIVRYAWTSPDQPFLEGTQRSLDDRFPFTGDYEVVLTVVDEDGLSASTSRTVTVSRPPPAGGGGSGGGGGGGGGGASIEIVFRGSGTGRVQLLGGEIECTDTCTVRLAPGRLYTLEATAEAGSFVSRFEGCDVGFDDPPDVCRVTLEGARRVSVFFE